MYKDFCDTSNLYSILNKVNTLLILYHVTLILTVETILLFPGFV